MQNITGRRTFYLLLILAAFSFFPFLGLTDYNTKGAPREAIVAVSMLRTGNWILPVNNGEDIAYKPPLFHWAIAAVSMPTGGVNEYTSCVPSVVAFMAMMMACYVFFRKRLDGTAALVASVLMLLTFETHRAAVATRVDMVLTAFIVLALLQFYLWYEKGMRGIPVWAVLFMSLATLTKGPVGIILPCGVMGAFLLMKGYRFFPVFFKLTGCAVAACVLPALWYAAAYRQRGQEFLDLVMEENFGRFLGKMSYRSHEQSVFYNFYITAAGLLPWTLLLAISLFFLRYRRPAGKVADILSGGWRRLRQMEPARLFSLLCVVLIFVFFCIPKSKRSVYLLPIYPFLLYFVAEYLIWLVKRAPRAWRIFGVFIQVVAVAVIAVTVALASGLFSGVEAVAGVAGKMPGGGWSAMWVTLPAAVLVWFARRKLKVVDIKYLFATLALFYATQIVLDGSLQPAVLNEKSMKPFAEEVVAAVPEGTIYSYVTEPMLHFFIVNFYAGDRVVRFQRDHPSEGVLLAGDADFAHWQAAYGASYETELVLRSARKGNDVKDYIGLYRFRRTE